MLFLFLMAACAPGPARRQITNDKPDYQQVGFNLVLVMYHWGLPSPIQGKFTGVVVAR